VVAEDVVLGDAEEYVGEEDLSSWFCLIGNVKTLGEIMQAYIF
jgi:hypothetical protein